jgi:ribonuclease HII
VVCAFAAPDMKWMFEGLNDSKKISKKKIPVIAKELMRQYASSFELVTVSAGELDAMGIEKAWRLAMEYATYQLIERVGVPYRVIIDGNKQPVVGAECYPQADGKYPCVMAASIIAKAYRDDLMKQAAALYPHYAFETNAGYGGGETSHHRKALYTHGLTPLHRRSYSPMSNFPRTG